MNARTNIQILNGPNGAPAFVVIPYADYLREQEDKGDYIPHEVVSLMVDNDWTPVRAWREHLGLLESGPILVYKHTNTQTPIKE
jgi:hypothetical protein